jgi:hypothetical protein
MIATPNGPPRADEFPESKRVNTRPSDPARTAEALADANIPGQLYPRSHVRAELGRIGDRFEEADRTLLRAHTLIDREEAEAARRDAMGAHWAAENDLADLQLLVLLMAAKHRREVLRDLLCEAVAKLAGRG